MQYNGMEMTGITLKNRLQFTQTKIGVAQWL